VFRVDSGLDITRSGDYSGQRYLFTPGADDFNTYECAG